MATILLIDDEPEIRALLRAVLESAGHTVTEAINGRDGLARYREQPADLVITDIHMPELSGLDLILELTREFFNVKVIAISGTQGEDTSVLNAAKLLGARQTLQKPFSLETFRAAVEYELVH
jgi:two-component system response regulator (stage 0 sporulation protein F)